MHSGICAKLLWPRFLFIFANLLEAVLTAHVHLGHLEVLGIAEVQQYVAYLYDVIPSAKSIPRKIVLAGKK